MEKIKRWVRYPYNLIFHFIWTDCQHKRRRLGKSYFPYCVDCGAVFSDYRYTIESDDEENRQG